MYNHIKTRGNSVDINKFSKNFKPYLPLLSNYYDNDETSDKMHKKKTDTSTLGYSVFNIDNYNYSKVLGFS